MIVTAFERGLVGTTVVITMVIADFPAVKPPTSSTTTLVVGVADLVVVRSTEVVEMVMGDRRVAVGVGVAVEAEAPVQTTRQCQI